MDRSKRILKNFRPGHVRQCEGVISLRQVMGGAMAEAGRGSIVNIGSIYGLPSQPRHHRFVMRKVRRFTNL